jgi:hypothetical protein
MPHQRRAQPAVKATNNAQTVAHATSVAVAVAVVAEPKPAANHPKASDSVQSAAKMTRLVMHRVATPKGTAMAAVVVVDQARVNLTPCAQA